MVSRRRDDRTARNVSLLISMLVRYPEVGSVKYEPRQQTIKIGLILTGELSDEVWATIEPAIIDTVEVYQMIEQREPEILELERESFGNLTALSITRDVVTMTPEEIYIIIEFFKERFAGRLVAEQVDWSGEEEMIAQDELIENVLADLEGSRTGRNLIAIREDGRVMVFQK